MVKNKTLGFEEDLSAYVDGESPLDDATTRALINRLESDPDSRAAWQRYHLVRDVMQHDYHPALPSDFAAKVSARLDTEAQDIPNVLPFAAPVQKRETAYRQVWAPMAGFGMAACLGAAVFFGTQLINPGNGTTPAGTTAALPLIDAPDPLDNPVRTEITLALADTGTRWNLSSDGERNSAVESRLNSLLTNHLENSTMASVHGMMSHARVVSYDDAAVSFNSTKSF